MDAGMIPNPVLVAPDDVIREYADSLPQLGELYLEAQREAVRQKIQEVMENNQNLNYLSAAAAASVAVDVQMVVDTEMSGLANICYAEIDQRWLENQLTNSVEKSKVLA
jgi:hypothetical protein